MPFKVPGMSSVQIVDRRSGGILKLEAGAVEKSLIPKAKHQVHGATARRYGVQPKSAPISAFMNGAQALSQPLSVASVTDTART
jgi:hypothetical protein